LRGGVGLLPSQRASRKVRFLPQFALNRIEVLPSFPVRSGLAIIRLEAKPNLSRGR